MTYLYRHRSEPFSTSSSLSRHLRSARVRALCAATVGLIAGLLAASLAEGAALAADEVQAMPADPSEVVAAPPSSSEESQTDAPADDSTTDSAEKKSDSKGQAIDEESAHQQPQSEEEAEEAEEAREEARELQEELEEEEQERREQERCRKEQAERGGPGAIVGDRCGDTSIGGYGGATIVGSRLDKTTMLLLGIEGGVIIDHRLSIGLAGFGMATEIKGPAFPNGADSVLGFGYGGVKVHYSIVGHGPIYLSAGVLVGGGVIALLERRDDSVEFNDETKSANGFLVVEPSVQLHANLTHWMRIGLDGGYRFVHGVDYFDYQEKDIRGVTLGGHVQFGWF